MYTIHTAKDINKIVKNCSMVPLATKTEDRWAWHDVDWDTWQISSHLHSSAVCVCRKWDFNLGDSPKYQELNIQVLLESSIIKERLRSILHKQFEYTSVSRNKLFMGLPGLQDRKIHQDYLGWRLWVILSANQYPKSTRCKHRVRIWLKNIIWAYLL